MHPDQLLENNRQWAAARQESDPDFFARLAAQQRPQYLWIGCSDSRVPANQIIGLDPGEVFVHRNVANQVVYTDLNVLSVLEYAVFELKVAHVIVVGHYGCGGVEAGYEARGHGLADNWLRGIGEIRRAHAAELDALPTRDARLRRLCELNVEAQVEHVCQTTVLQNAWSRGLDVHVHGWIYDLKDGLVRRLLPGRPGNLGSSETRL